MEEEALSNFMQITGCGEEEAFNYLSSCAGHLGRAVNSFFNMDAGPSGTTRSPPPSPRSGSEDAVPARRRTRSPRPDSASRSRSRSSTRVSRWDSETRVDYRSSRRREGDDGGTAPGDRDADGNGHSRGRRRRRYRQRISSDDDEEEENNSRRRRRRLDPTTEGGKEAHDNTRHVMSISSSSDDDDGGDMLEEAPQQKPAPPPRNRTFEELFRVPHELTYKGGFHGAKAHAARQARWLLASVQSFELPLPSLYQNRDVWGSDLVSGCVRAHFVLWQADADAGDDAGEEARKVLAYYNVPRAGLPAVVVVDPVTGQAMDVLNGSAAYDLNDFIPRLAPFTDTRPAIPVFAKKSTATGASAGGGGGAQNNRCPDAATSSERAGSRQQAPETVRKPPDAPVAAVAVVPTAATDQPPESVETKVCKLRVRLADGRVVAKEFGSQCAVAALFEYCRSEELLGAGGAAPEKPFRLFRLVGRAMEEIVDDQNASFQSLGLHMTTVLVRLG